jgi:hypothetical protein
MTFLLIIFFEKSCQSTQIHIHLNRDPDSVSSSTDCMKPLGPIPSSWRIPAPCMYLRRAAASSSGENTSRSVKPAALNSLHLIIITAGICEESTFSVESHSSNLKPNAFSSTRFCRLQSLRCFHTFTAVCLLDLVAKLLQAGEQRDAALREEDGCLEVHPAAAVLLVCRMTAFDS